MLRLELVSRDVNKLGASLKKLQNVLSRPKYRAFIADGSINFKIIDAAAMSKLNFNYAKDKYATDVLSFPYKDAAGERLPQEELGDVAINLDRAKSQAKQYKVNIEAELANLALHGTLHILGFDHVTLADQQAMQSLQDEILGAAGLTTRQFEWKA